MELPTALLRCEREPKPQNDMQPLADRRLGPGKVAAKRPAPNEAGSKKKQQRAGRGANSAKEPVHPLGVADEAHARDQLQIVMAMSKQNRLLHAGPQAAQASFGTAAAADTLLGGGPPNLPEDTELEAERVSTRLDEDEEIEDEELDVGTQDEELDVGTETSQPKWGGASLAPAMTKVLERLRLKAAASQKAAKDMQELANAEALELQQVRKAAEVSLSMYGESPQAIMAPSVETVLPPLGLSPTPRNENCTWLAQLLRVGPTLQLKISIRALQLPNKLGQPCTNVIGGRLAPAMATMLAVATKLAMTMMLAKHSRRLAPPATSTATNPPRLQSLKSPHDLLRPPVRAQASCHSIARHRLHPQPSHHQRTRSLCAATG